jgi:ketosteroid isomerase-like protein
MLNLNAATRKESVEYRMTADEEIRHAIDRFAVAYRSGDLDALLAYYSEDLIKDRAGALSEHKAQTAERIREIFATHSTDIAVTVDEIVSSGDLAFVRGSFAINLTSRSGGRTREVVRRYLEIWRHEPAGWRVFRTMDNETT